MRLLKDTDGKFLVVIDKDDIELGTTNNIVFWEQIEVEQKKADELNKPPKKIRKVKDESKST